MLAICFNLVFIGDRQYLNIMGFDLNLVLIFLLCKTVYFLSIRIQLYLKVGLILLSKNISTLALKYFIIQHRCMAKIMVMGNLMHSQDNLLTIGELLLVFY